MKLGSALVLGMVLIACDTEPGSTFGDGGTTPIDSDAGEAERDAGPRDGGPRDGGPRDAGPRDGGVSPFPGTLTNWCAGQPANFGFFVTSMSALWTLSGDSLDDLNGGFGGDFGGVEGADLICQTIANATGHGDKTWRAFLSATDDGNGNPVHAIDRIGAGPWSDANGRLVASGLAGLSGDRPDGDQQSTLDLPDECGVPISTLGDAHDVVTGSDRSGRLASTDLESTCLDWMSSDETVGMGQGGGGPGGGLGPVNCGHSFPRSMRNGRNWASDHGLRGCGKGANLLQNGAGNGSCIGCSGGYGGLYCFAQ